MSFTTPPTFSSGAVLTAAQLNILGDDLNYLYQKSTEVSFSGTRLSRSTNQGIPDSTYTPAVMDTEQFDSGGWFPGSGSTVTVPAGAIPSGFTTIIVIGIMYVTFSANSTGIRRARVSRDGSPFVSNAYSAASADTTDLTGSQFTTATAGATFNLEAYQSSGGTLNATTLNLSIVRYAALS